MKNWQYFGILSTIWIAPVPTSSWNTNLMIGLVLGIASVYFAVKGE